MVGSPWPPRKNRVKRLSELTLDNRFARLGEAFSTAVAPLPIAAPPNIAATRSRTGEPYVDSER